MPTKHTQDMAELHEQILTGERETPPRFSAEGRAYAKWRKEEKRHAREMEKRQQMLGGITPVLSLIHISEPTRREWLSRMTSSA